VSGPIRVLIVDDHRMFAQAISLLLQAEVNIEVVGIATTGESAVQTCSTGCPDVVLMDIHLPGMDGVQTTRRLLEKCPATRVVVVSAISDSRVVAEALEAGARAYVPKTEVANKVIGIIRKSVGENGGLTPPAGRQSSDDLTSRELQVLQAIAEGMSTAQVARWLFVSPSTIRTHVKNILLKLGTHSKLGAVLEGARRGFIRVADRDSRTGSQESSEYGPGPGPVAERTTRGG